MLLFAFLLGGFYFGSMPPEKGDFTFDLPEGYRIAGITDKSCSILDSNDTIDLFETIPDRQEKKVYARILFVKDSGVYDMWFDRDLMSGVAISEFYPIANSN